ncbi:MAG: DUF86 domain-containing protein [Dehalococcoidia bacterium]|nr:DUF86 domain-containing protein [Dehalococcoidia bacterium]
MDSSERDAHSLRDILHAAELISSFIQGMSLDEFRADRKTRSAVLHELMVIGEATKRLSPAFREAHSEVAWGEIAGMRDMIAHQYDRISTGIAWETSTLRVPGLHDYVQRVLEELDA